MFGPLCGFVCEVGVGFPSTALVVLVFCVLPLLRCVRFVCCLLVGGRCATWHFCTKWSNDRHLLHLEERPLYSREYSISPSLSSLGIMMEWGRASTLLVRMRTLGPDSRVRYVSVSSTNNNSLKFSETLGFEEMEVIL